MNIILQLKSIAFVITYSFGMGLVYSLFWYKKHLFSKILLFFITIINIVIYNGILYVICHNIFESHLLILNIIFFCIGFYVSYRLKKCKIV